MVESDLGSGSGSGSRGSGGPSRASVRVMAGSHGGVTGPIKMRNPGLLMDVRLPPGAKFTQEVCTANVHSTNVLCTV